MRNLKDQDLQNNLPLFQSDSLRIERMIPSDLEEVMEIESLAFPSAWARSYFLHEIRNNRSAFPIVLREVGQSAILGFAICWILPDELHICNVAVHPLYRNHGYGRML